ncbi:MAG: UPF0104 family protein [Cytophagales bacterium]|nr:MAG: UPF0104 family protein [Cytophagales bacterium]
MCIHLSFFILTLLKKILKIFIPLLLAVALLWYILQKVDLKELLEKFSEVNYYWVFFAILISIFSHILRATRWRLMILPLGYSPRMMNLFTAVMSGYFANIFLPRAGEFLRCVSLNKSEQVPANLSFGTVIAERAIDFLCLLVLIFLSLLLEYEMFACFISKFILSGKKSNFAIVFLLNHWLIIVVIGLFLLLGLFFLRKKIMNLAIVKKIVAFLLGIWAGVISIKDLNNKSYFIIQTLAIWVCYYLMTYFMFYALPSTANLSLIAGLVILIVGGLGMSAPVSGGIGPFHLMVAGALELFYGLSQKDGIAYAFLIHTSQMLMVIIIGGLLLLLSLFKYKANSSIKVQ